MEQRMENEKRRLLTELKLIPNWPINNACINLYTIYHSSKNQICWTLIFEKNEIIFFYLGVYAFTVAMNVGLDKSVTTVTQDVTVEDALVSYSEGLLQYFQSQVGTVEMQMSVCLSVCLSQKIFSLNLN